MCVVLQEMLASSRAEQPGVRLKVNECITVTSCVCVIVFQEMLASSRAEQSGVRLEVNERIIDSCTALTKAIKILIQKSKTLQREIVDQGRVGAVIVDQGRVAAVIVDQGRVWPGIVDYALLLRRTIGVANCDCMHSHVLTASKKLNQKLQQFIARAYRLCAVRAPVCVHGVCVCVLSQGTATSKEFYKKHHRWTEGLISAAKAVGWGANVLT